MPYQTKQQHKKHNRLADIQHEQHDQTERILFVIPVTIKQYLCLGEQIVMILESDSNEKCALNTGVKEKD